MLSLLLALTGALPPITSTVEALAQLRGADKTAALANVKEACRGKYRRELRDNAQLEKQLESMLDTAALARAVLDTHPCFSAKTFGPLIERALKNKDDAVVAYGAEVSARLEDPSLVAMLHAAMEPRKSACLGPDLSNSTADVCVWLTYAPGALLASADEATRTKAGEHASEMTEAQLPKIREVAVETLASTRLPAFAQKITELIWKESKNAFPKPNSKELIDRFKDREKTLKKGQTPR